MALTGILAATIKIVTMEAASLNQDTRTRLVLRKMKMKALNLACTLTSTTKKTIAVDLIETWLGKLAIMMWVGVNLNRIITGCECLKTVVTTSMIFPSLRLKVVQRPSKSYLQKRWKLNRPWGSVKMQKKAIVAPCQRKNS